MLESKSKSARVLSDSKGSDLSGRVRFGVESASALIPKPTAVWALGWGTGGVLLLDA